MIACLRRRCVQDLVHTAFGEVTRVRANCSQLESQVPTTVAGPVRIIHMVASVAVRSRLDGVDLHKTSAYFFSLVSSPYVVCCGDLRLRVKCIDPGTTLAIKNIITRARYIWWRMLLVLSTRLSRVV